MHDLSLSDCMQALKEKKISSTELTTHYLSRIEKYQASINAFITITTDVALDMAKKADALIAKGNAPRLTGIPIAQKDLFCTKDIKTSCASRMLDNFISPYNATTVENFHRAHMPLLGKTNMDEFAMGASNEKSFYGKVHNPWDLNRVPGGSSGGSAAAVAAYLCPGATGSDTGGSIRQPASLCNLTGIKPSYGRVSRYGMVAFASSLDQGGLFARSAEDSALLLTEMAGFDPKDSTSVNQSVPDYYAQLKEPLPSFTIGIPSNFTQSLLGDKIKQLLDNTRAVFENLGARFVEITLPHHDLAVPCYYVLGPAECSSNLSRYDGIRFGYQCENPKDLHDLYCRSRSEGFGPEVQRRILIGTYALSAGYYDAYYLQAQKVRRLITNDYLEAFKKVDLILMPTTPGPAFHFNDNTTDYVKTYQCDYYTIPANLAGLPAISAPGGFIDNLPVGFQLIAPHFEESRLLQATHAFQQVTDFHQKKPQGL
jgi:aspartyl-tRNA(Asn)/glutamyl-tRNA(Gln) amidotransferase subunit A